MQLDEHDYRDLLNYDKHTRKFLTYGERLRLHNAIRASYNNVAVEFRPELITKIRKIKAIMIETQWKRKNVNYEKY